MDAENKKNLSLVQVKYTAVHENKNECGKKKRKMKELVAWPSQDILVQLVSPTTGDRHLTAVSGELEQTLEGHSGGVRSAQFGPDGQKIVSASYDRTVRVWSA